MTLACGRLPPALLLLVLCAVPHTAAAQAAPAAPAAPSRTEIVAAARKVIASAQYATLVTVDGSGQPQARVIDPFVPEDDFTIWIGTNALSRKVGEIAGEPRVTLLYFDRASESFVTLIGTAAAVRDPREKAKHWKDSWATFYKDGPRGDDYLLLRVTPARLEIVAPGLGMMNDPVTWKPVVLDLK